MGAVEADAHAEALRRSLAWDGCFNVRDLGGLETASGGRTRRGVVVRADNVRRLTAAGWQAALDHGVRRVVDLRFEDEAPGEPGCARRRRGDRRSRCRQGPRSRGRAARSSRRCSTRTTSRRSSRRATSACSKSARSASAARSARSPTPRTATASSSIASPGKDRTGIVVGAAALARRRAATSSSLPTTRRAILASSRCRHRGSRRPETRPS